jgi:hypothetical protein
MVIPRLASRNGVVVEELLLLRMPPLLRVM